MDNTKNTVKKYLKRYFIDAMGAMALGLFASLLIGTIFKALGMIPHCEFLAQIGGYAQSVAGPTMAVAIAYSLCKDPLVIFSSAAVGYAANLLGAADLLPFCSSRSPLPNAAGWFQRRPKLTSSSHPLSRSLSAEFCQYFSRLISASWSDTSAISSAGRRLKLPLYRDLSSPS